VCIFCARARVSDVALLSRPPGREFCVPKRTFSLSGRQTTVVAAAAGGGGAVWKI